MEAVTPLCVGIVAPPTIVCEGIAAVVRERLGGRVRRWSLEELEHVRADGLDAVVMDAPQQALPLALDGLGRAGVEPWKVLVLREASTPAEKAELLRLNVGGYVTLRDTSEALGALLLAIARGEALTRQHAPLRAVEAGRWRWERAARLSRREEEVLHLLALGFSNERIAARLHLAHGTVRNVVSAVYEKAGVRTRPEAILWAWQEGYAGQARS